MSTPPPHTEVPFPGPPADRPAAAAAVWLWLRASNIGRNGTRPFLV